MVKKNPVIITCSECHKEKDHEALGLCKRCYNNKYHHRRYSTDPVYRRRCASFKGNPCRLIMSASIELKNDYEAMVHDLDFVEEFTGLRCNGNVMREKDDNQN